MNSLHSVSASKNDNTQHTAQLISIRWVTAHAMVVRDAYDCAVCCILLLFGHTDCVQTVHLIIFCPI